MNHTITTTLSSDLYGFIKNESITRKTTYKKILTEAVTDYKKQKMAEQIRQGLLERNKEQSQIAQEFQELQSLSLQNS